MNNLADALAMDPAVLASALGKPGLVGYFTALREKHPSDYVDWVARMDYEERRAGEMEEYTRIVRPIQLDIARQLRRRNREASGVLHASRTRARGRARQSRPSTSPTRGSRRGSSTRAGPDDEGGDPEPPSSGRGRLTHISEILPGVRAELAARAGVEEVVK